MPAAGPCSSPIGPWTPHRRESLSPGYFAGRRKIRSLAGPSCCASRCWPCWRARSARTKRAKQSTLTRTRCSGRPIRSWVTEVKAAPQRGGEKGEPKGAKRAHEPCLPLSVPLQPRATPDPWSAAAARATHKLFSSCSLRNSACNGLVGEKISPLLSGSMRGASHEDDHLRPCCPVGYRHRRRHGAGLRRQDLL